MKNFFHRILVLLYGEKPTCRYCGEETASYRQQFCSEEHRDLYWVPLDRWPQRNVR